ncbi:MAG: hypothetical protein RI519_07190 [Balneolaceae bacterium]|nr:hypothetical protein [Balneolaceae bacterium]
MAPNSHFCKIVNPNALSNPRMITNRQPPWKFYTQIRLENHSITHLGSEKSQQPNTVARAWNPRTNQYHLYDQPKRFNPSASPTIERF